MTADDTRGTDAATADARTPDPLSTTAAAPSRPAGPQEDTMSHTPGTDGPDPDRVTSDDTPTLSFTKHEEHDGGSARRPTTETRPWEVAPGWTDQARSADGHAPAGPVAAGPTGTGSSTPAPAPRGLRVGTVVWGLVVALIGVGLLALAAGIEFDVQLAFILLVALAGVGLLVGSVVTASRRRPRT